ncbi:MAG: hypothetical protein JRN06_00320 [Nitrososphaerota archaeon]|nr:hypothetical protein [Nitrososphaerota archaeon]MDG7023703.1 hypothetical protein [Nitrososphaerota archaeon]
MQLFSPGVLDLFHPDEMWTKPLILRSAPGGGKTSLLRIFTPQALLTLFDARSSDEYKELYSGLRDLGALSEEGPTTLGIMLSCSKNYAELEDLRLPNVPSLKLFYSLLNSRLTIAALRGSMVINRLRYPQDLNRLKILRPTDFDVPNSIPLPCTGAELNEWASKVENNVCEAADSFGSVDERTLSGHETLSSLLFLRPELLLLDGQPFVSRVLMMLDDVHRIAPSQRKAFLDLITRSRFPVGLWLAERLEALSPIELIGTGALPGRDYVELNLEDYWRGEGNPRRFERILGDIADRRASLNPSVRLPSFAACLGISMDDIESVQKFEAITSDVEKRVAKLTASTRKYDDWILRCRESSGAGRDSAIAWRSLEIAIERDSRKGQQTLVDAPVPVSESELEEPASVREAAALFLAQESQVPYYFGFQQLSKLASSNVEQFLVFAAAIFEEAISANLIQRGALLSPSRQESILKRAARERLDAVILAMPRGDEVRAFLEHVCNFCRSETYKPNAPYAPGVTGIAITMSERGQLLDEKTLAQRSDFKKVTELVSLCLAYNLMDASLDRSQGNDRWMILYLNRLLCALNDLPLHYGGWRPLSLAKLVSFSGRVVPEQSEVPLN